MKPITASDVSDLAHQIAEMLSAKNAAYGNSVFDPVRIFSKASAIEQIKVRIDDKLSRICRGHEFPGDDTLMDLAGYLVILLVAMDRGDDHLAPDPAHFDAAAMSAAGFFHPDMDEMTSPQHLEIFRQELALNHVEIRYRAAIVMTMILQQRREQSEGLRLDPRPARALTSRECCKILCGVLSSINHNESVLNAEGMKVLLRTMMAAVGIQKGALDEDLGFLEALSCDYPKLLGHMASVAALTAALLESSGPEPVERAIRWLLETENGSQALELLCSSEPRPILPPLPN